MLRADCPELRDLSPARASQGGDNPPANPPKAKAFDAFAFARLYRLESAGSAAASRVVAQEIHLIVGHTFAVTIRYGCLAWDPARLLERDTEVLERTSDPGIDLGSVREAHTEFTRQYRDGRPAFGMALAGVLIDHVVDSVFDTLNALRLEADRLEIEVLHRGNWIWDRRKTAAQDRRMYGLRWLLRQIRWAFMPDDEIDELTAGPFIGVTDDDPLMRFRYEDLGREADRALASVNDITDQVQQTMSLRDTIKTDRLNDTLYLLTVIATVLLIPTVIAGIYGMNFDNIPELHWRLGYFGALATMVLIGGVVWYAIRRYLRRSSKG
jgi:hypothetical protein